MDNKIMLLLVACFAFIHVSNAAITQQVATFSEEETARIQAEIKKCVANESDLLELVKIIREGRYREDEEFKNFIHCAYKSSGYAYDNGRVKTEKGAAIFPDPEVMLKVMNICDEERSTPVETTFEYFKCFQQKSPYLIGL